MIFSWDSQFYIIQNLNQLLMKKTEEQKFLAVKEQLDYYRLPTTFPFQATDLLEKLLSLVKRSQQNNKENINSKNLQPSNELNQALRLQISKVVHQNNRLHMELISAREEIDGLKFSIEKHQISKLGSREESKLLVDIHKRREEQLFQELKQVKFKYNQLMDLIHEDPNIQKQYIKRLLKHKKLIIEEPRVLMNVIGQKQRKISQHQSNTELEQKVKFLQSKLANRQSEILRLQKKTEYDGLNMNKILKDFQNDRTNNKISVLEQNIKYLEEENKKMKEQVKKTRKNGGSKEALKQQTRKNHQTIKQISDGNRSLKRKLKEKQFDQEARQKEIRRQVNEVNKQNSKLQSDYQLAQLTIQDLQKKIEFLKKQLDSSKQRLIRQQRGNMDKEIIIDQMKNTQEGGRILSQYEIEDLKKKLGEMQELLINAQNKIAQITKQNKYYEDQGIIKSEAIENLQKIVDELMKRQNIHKIKSQINEESLITNIDQAILLKKQLAQIRHLLALTKNENMKLEQELQNLRMRYDQKIRENAGFSEEISRMKNQIYEIKRLETDQYDSEKILNALRMDLKKQQALKNKLQAMQQDTEAQNNLLRKQIKEISEQYDLYAKKTKAHLNQATNDKAELVETIQLLQLRIKDKDRKIQVYEQDHQKLQNKITILRDQVNLLEDQKHGLIREKNRIQKKFHQESVVKNQEQNYEQLKYMAINQHEVTRYKRQIEQLNDHISNLQIQILDYKETNEQMRSQKEQIISEKIALVKENKQIRAQCNKLEEKIKELQDN